MLLHGCLVLALVCCLGHGAVAWNHVTQQQLQDALDSNGYTLVAFVLPSHGDSEALEPEWLAMQETEKDDNIVSFDCHAHSMVCSDLEVASFPAIRLYHRDGRIDRYRGLRKGREIAMFLHRMLRPPYLETDEHLSGVMTMLDDVVVMAHTQPDDWDFFDQFRSLANKYRDRFSFVAAPPVGDTSVLVCYSNIDDVKHTASDVVTAGAMESFINMCAEPLIPDWTEGDDARYRSAGKSIVHYFATSDAEKETYRQEMRALAKKYANTLRFTITDANKDPDSLTKFGLKPEVTQKTGLALENTTTGDIFLFTGHQDVTAPVVEAFIEDITRGNVQPWDRRVRKEQISSHDEL